LHGGIISGVKRKPDMPPAPGSHNYRRPQAARAEPLWKGGMCGRGSDGDVAVSIWRQLGKDISLFLAAAPGSLEGREWSGAKIFFTIFSAT